MDSIDLTGAHNLRVENLASLYKTHGDGLEVCLTSRTIVIMITLEGLKELEVFGMFKRVFNLVYFGAAIAVYAWLLRDDPHTRIIPVLSLLLAGLYAFLAFMTACKPSGFEMAAHAPVISLRHARRLRRWAILLPIPAFLYCMTYTACLTWAGESMCLNKFFGPIARFERAAFSKDRAISFEIQVSDRLYNAMRKWENVNLRKAISYGRAFNRLERGVWRCSPGADVILGELYERYGCHEKAHRLFARAENCHVHGMIADHHTDIAALLNEQAAVGEYKNASVAHILMHVKGMPKDEVAAKYPAAASFLKVRDAGYVGAGAIFTTFRTDEIPPCDHYCDGIHNLK